MVSFRRDAARTTKIVIAATANALDIAVESLFLVGVCIVDRISGGFREFVAFDGTLGTAVVLHAGEERGVVFVATGLLDLVSGGCCPRFRRDREACRLVNAAHP